LQALAHEVACYLGLDLGGIKIKRFADGEIYVQVQVHPQNSSSHFKTADVTAGWLMYVATVCACDYLHNSDDKAVA